MRRGVIEERLAEIDISAVQDLIVELLTRLRDTAVFDQSSRWPDRSLAGLYDPDMTRCQPIRGQRRS